MTTRVGINGFGRIGRNFLRAAREQKAFQVVAANDISSPKTLAHLLRYDSILGRYPGEVEATEDSIVVDGQQIRIFAEPAPGDVNWGALGVEVVVESSGRFRRAEQARGHIKPGGARKVVITSPARGEDITICMGVNHDAYRPDQHHIISNASCTTNCLAPLAKVLHERFGIETGLMSTVHAYTGDQRLLDAPHKDPRRSRAAGLSMIPTSSGAAHAVTKVLPELEGKFHGLALRVPTPDVSIVDFTAVLSRPTNPEAVNQALREYALGPMKGILRVEDEELVSIDFRGDPHSSVVDAPLTVMAGDRHVKVLAWYDNEWGYSCRVADLTALISQRLRVADPV
ncbi:MAG: type I glyceraldehyde-3-phosphate dehydrogenase [Candidatus Dormibacteria bacterium]